MDHGLSAVDIKKSQLSTDDSELVVNLEVRPQQIVL
jgi:hypothetical protein